MITIGLFGTCGTSTWRNAFMTEYGFRGINFFNPQVEDWKPEDADNEAKHLETDEIVLFPVTSETYGSGSLSEVGFSILNAIKLNDRRFFVIMIEPEVDEKLMKESPITAAESNRDRRLVLAHLKKIKFSNVFVVNTLHEMMTLSFRLYKVVIELERIQNEFR